MENVTSLEINDVTFPTLQEIYKNVLTNTGRSVILKSQRNKKTKT